MKEIYIYKIITYHFLFLLYIYIGRFLKLQKRSGPAKQIQDMLVIVLIFEHLEGLYVIGK